MADSAPEHPLRQRLLPLGIFGFALLVRVLYVVSIKDAYFFMHLTTEPQHYDAWASAIVDGTAHATLPFDEAPAYPYVVALIYAVVGHSVLAVTLVQALLGALGCAAIARVAAAMSSPRAGWIAGLVAACFAPLIYFTGQLEPAALAAAVVAGALALTPLDERASARRWLVAALAWSAAMWVRSELVLAIPLLVAHAWLVAGRRRALHVALVPALALVLSLGANIASSRHPVLLTTGSGINLFLGNNEHADGVNPFVHGPLVPVVQEVESRAHDATAADQAFRDLALEAMSAAPGRTLALAAKKLAWTLSRRELPNAADIGWQTQQSWLYVPPVFPIGFGTVFPLACAGIVLLGRDWRRRLVLAAPIVVALVTCVVLFTNARFRLTMMPSLLVLAGLAIDRLLRREKLVPATVAIVVGALVVWVPIAGIAHYRVPQIDANTGVLEHGAGHLARAERYFKSAVRGDPDDGPTWTQLAITLEQQGKTAEAQEAWRQATRLQPKL